MASIEENNSIVEYVDGLCNSMYALEFWAFWFYSSTSRIW